MISKETSLFKIDSEHIYAMCVVSAFALLLYANADQQEVPGGTVMNLGIGKLFYFPCGVALLCSFLMKNTQDKLSKILNWMVFLALISTLLHPQESPNLLIWTATRFIFAILCFRGIRYIDPKLIVCYATILAPIIVLPHYFLTNPFGYGAYRYGGFYGDPNFLAISLNLLITLCYLSFKFFDSNFLRVSAIISILFAIPLILLGVSRGGIIGLSVIGFFILRDIYKSSKMKFTLLLVFALAFSGPVIVKLGSTFDFIEARFSNESSSDANGAKARLDGIESCLNVLSNRLDLIPFGIGPGNTTRMIPEYRAYGYITKYAIHNTYFSLLYEFGLIIFILFLKVYWFAFKRLKDEKQYLLLGLFLSSAFCLFTLPGVSFMPAWILLFFVLNDRIPYFNKDNK